MLRVEPLEPRCLLDGALGSDAIELFNASPALFVANEGQWEDPSVRYAFHGAGATVLHTDSGPQFQLYQRDAIDPNYLEGENGQLADLREKHLVATRETEFSVHFDGAQRIAPTGLDRAAAVQNYQVGDQATWRSAVPTYETVAYTGLYEGIDLFTWGRRDSLKYEFHVAPGADYRPIQISYDGIEGLSLDDAGDLHVATELGELIDGAPYIYQVVDGQQTEVAGQFALIDDDTFTFDVTGSFDPTLELVIDPDLEWSTYLGEDRAKEVDVAIVAAQEGIVPGILVYGYAYSHRDCFVTKISEDVQSGVWEPVWTTYFGGSNVDWSTGIAVDADGNVIVTGFSGYSKKLSWVSGGYDTNGKSGGFVVKLDSAGNPLWSTFVKEGRDECYLNDVAVDSVGDIFVTGRASWEWDVFAAKISSDGQQLVWSTRLGGDSSDEANGIALDSAGNVLLTGSTSSDGWISGGFDTELSGGDAFVVKLNGAGGHEWSTYLGGSDSENGDNIALAADDSIFITGSTYSADWVASGPENPWQQDGFDIELNGGSDAFVAKLASDGAGLWATYVGGDQDERHCRGVAVDENGNAVVTGYTTSVGWVSGGFDESHNGESDAFVAMLSSVGGHVWSSYLGGANSDSGHGIAIDADGYAYIVGSTSSPNWVSGGYDTTPFTESDGFLARIRIDSGPPMPGITATPTYSLVTSEYGATDEFTVVLNTQPASDVTLGITSLDPTEGTVFPSTDELTFTSADWDVPQTVIVAGEDDQEVDSDIVYAVQVAVVETDDPLYQNLDPVSVSVTNLDNESPYEFTSQDVPQEIADPHPKQGLRPAVSELFIADTHIIVGTVEVDVVIEHEYMYDLTATITSATNLSEDLVYASGIWRVEDQTAFAGISLDGTWTLTITDHVKNGATGALNSWSLIVTPAAAGNGSNHALPPTVVASPTDTAHHIASFRKVESPRVHSAEGPISSDRLQVLLRSELRTQEQSTAVNRRELIKFHESHTEAIDFAVAEIEGGLLDSQLASLLAANWNKRL